jgi:NodT family efflux transporter outer membrane factor (OMF) lipoprotein
MILLRVPLVWTIIFLSGCVVGPAYKKPVVTMPESFKHSSKSASSDDLISWWDFFCDQDLLALIKKGIDCNLDLAIAMERIEGARSKYKLEFAKLLPQIVTLADALKVNLGNELLFGDGDPNKPFNSNFLGIATLWEVDLWGKLRRSGVAALNDWESLIENMRDIYIMLIADIAKAYNDVRILEKKIVFAQELISLEKNIFTLDVDSFNAGIDSTILSIDEAIAVENSQADLSTLIRMLEQTKNRLAVLIGEQPEKFCLQSSTTNIFSLIRPIDPGTPCALLRRRPDIRAVERSLAAATERTGAAIAELFPSFSLLGLVGGGSGQRAGIKFPLAPSWAIGPIFYWPLYDFGRIKGHIQIKKSEQKEALLKYEKTVLAALEDVENWLIGYYTQQERVSFLHQKTKAVQQKSILAGDSFQAGLISERNYYAIERERLVLETEFIDAQGILNNYLIGVYKAVGGGW